MNAEGDENEWCKKENFKMMSHKIPGEVAKIHFYQWFRSQWHFNIFCEFFALCLFLFFCRDWQEVKNAKERKKKIFYSVDSGVFHSHGKDGRLIEKSGSGKLILINFQEFEFC